MTTNELIRRHREGAPIVVLTSIARSVEEAKEIVKEE